MTICTHCNRPFRSKSAAERAARYRAVHEGLRTGAEVEHLKPQAVKVEPFIPKQERHRMDSDNARRGLI